MTTVYRIRDNESGIEVEHCVDYLSDSLCDFWWTDGNMACDCNRKMQWARGLRFDENEEDLETGFPCGPIGNARRAYTLVFVRVNGVEIVRDDKATDAAECD